MQYLPLPPLDPHPTMTAKNKSRQAVWLMCKICSAKPGTFYSPPAFCELDCPCTHLCKRIQIVCLFDFILYVYYV